MLDNKKQLKTGCKFVIIIVLLTGMLGGYPLKTKSADDNQANQVEKLQKQIEQLDQKIEKKASKQRTIEEEIIKIEKNISQIQAEIRKTNQTISQFDQKIARKNNEIVKIEKDVQAKRVFLAEYLRLIQRGFSEIELVFLNNSSGLGGYFQEVERYEEAQAEIKRVLSEIKQHKAQIQEEKEAVEEERTEQKKILALQADQKSSLAYEQNRKKFFLKKTRKDISALSVERDELKKQLSALQSLGKPINLEEAIKTAKYVSKKTGVRTAFLLGVLRVESNLGQNVGGGTYKTDMHPSQWEIFKKICRELGLNPKKMPVSRRVCYNKKAKDGCGGWGGAMGPAQFMPSTWMGYKDKVAKITGHQPANPWNLKDALVAMGLKLAQIPGVTAHKESAERKAASMYLAGGNWKHYTWYGDRVLYYADGFERYMTGD